MIEIKVYDNAVEIDGHDDLHICSEVSLSRYLFSNNLGYYGQRTTHISHDGSGYSLVKFNITKDTEILRDCFYDCIKLWLDTYYPNRVKVERLKGDMR